MIRPLVSVCFITYNHRDYVAQALRSVAEQEYEPLEILVADDGSTDGTYETLVEIAQQYPNRVRLLPQRTNSGLSGIGENYTRALRECRGEFVAFLEGDDEYLPGKIAAQVQWFDGRSARVLCGHDVEAFDSASGRPLYRWGERFGLANGRGCRGLLLHGVPFSTVSIMLRRSAVPATGTDARLQVVLDWKLWIDCLGLDREYGHVPSVLARYRRHPGNVSSKFAAVGRVDQFLTLALVEEATPETHAWCTRGRARLHYAHGVAHVLAADAGLRARARESLRAAVRTSPRHYWKALAVLVLARLAPSFLRRRIAPGTDSIT